MFASLPSPTGSAIAAARCLGWSRRGLRSVDDGAAAGATPRLKTLRRDQEYEPRGVASGGGVGTVATDGALDRRATRAAQPTAAGEAFGGV